MSEQEAERTCGWCGSQTHAKYPVCQSCNRHKNQVLSHVPIAGILVALCMTILATYQYIEAQEQKQFTNATIVEAKETLVRAKLALENADLSKSTSREALVAAQKVLELAGTAAEEATIANAQAKQALATSQMQTSNRRPAQKKVARIVKPVSRPKPIKKKSLDQLKTEAIDRVRTQEELTSDLATKKQRLKDLIAAYDEKNASRRFLTTASEFARGRANYTQELRNEIALLENKLSASR